MLKYVVVLALFVAVAWADDAVAVEPSIVEGEDLDVPTWKRLKMKLRR